MQTKRKVPSVLGHHQPASWGKDELSAYLEEAQRNRLATFANSEIRYSKLRAIDSCFADVVKDWRNPPHPVAAMLLIRTQSSFRVACSAAMAGQVVEAFVLIRAMLEASGYAAHISRCPGLEETWLRRHDDVSAMRSQKTAFKIRAVKQSISIADGHAAERFGRLYQEAIDFGGHPNPNAILGSTSVQSIDGGKKLNQIILHAEGLPMEHALLSVCRSGLCALEVLQIAFSARFELLGISERMLALRHGL